ncbi:HslU--HslV peptidase proteolytic subunit [bacterium]|nr:MAG: HslU--HslV peptidase proteolytic subunit [bacterium]
MEYHSTTILGIVRDGNAVIGGDGQVSLGEMIVKSNSSKVRYLADDSVLAGFAGAAADGFALLSRFEDKLQEHHDLLRAAVELAKEWRTDRYLRRLEAELAVLNEDKALLLTGVGDVLEPEDGIVAIGSGAGYALASARSMLKFGKKMPIEKIVENALMIASQICIYTNSNITVLKLNEE